jgi:hypothetical protein
MTYTANRKGSLAALRDSYERQLQATEIMCAGIEKERKFDESMVKRAGGKFATKEEKAAMAQELADRNAAILFAAEPGIVRLPNGDEVYKLTDKQAAFLNNYDKEIEALAAPLAALAATDPAKAVEQAKKLEAMRQEAMNKVMAEDKTIEDSQPEAVATIKNGVAKAAVEKDAPVKAKAFAQVTKAIAGNLSDDQVQKGVVQVTKQLNSGVPAKPADVMAMMKKWADQAQANIDKGVKKIQTGTSENKAKVLAAGTGLMTKISELAAVKAIGAGIDSVGKGFSDAANDLMNSDAAKAAGNAANAAGKALGDGANAVKNSTVGKAIGDGANAAGRAIDSGKKAIGDGANATGKAIGNKVEDFEFSADITKIPGELGQVGKGLFVDARQTAKRAEIGLKDARKGAIKGLGDAANDLMNSDAAKAAENAANAAGKALGDGANAAGRAIDSGKKAIGDGVERIKNSDAAKALSTPAGGVALAVGGGTLGGTLGGIVAGKIFPNYKTLGRIMGGGEGTRAGLATYRTIKNSNATSSPGNQANSQVVGTKPSTLKVLGDAASKEAEKKIAKPLSPGNQANSQVVGTNSLPQNSFDRLKKVGSDARTSLKNGGLGDAVKAIPGLIRDVGESTGKLLGDGNNLIRKPINQIIAENPSLSAVKNAVVKELGVVNGELSNAKETFDRFTANAGQQANEKIQEAKTGYAKQQKIQQEVLDKARQKVLESSKVERLARQREAEAAVSARFSRQ